MIIIIVCFFGLWFGSLRLVAACLCCTCVVFVSLVAIAVTSELLLGLQGSWKIGEPGRVCWISSRMSESFSCGVVRSVGFIGAVELVAAYLRSQKRCPAHQPKSTSREP